MGFWISVLVQALYFGSVYSLIALGLTVVFNATRVVNFAQGQYFVLGAAAGYELQGVHRMPVAVTLLGVIAVAVVAGLVTERAIMLPVNRSGSPYAWIIATIAVALIAEALFNRFFTSVVLQPPPLSHVTWTAFGGQVSLQEVVIIAAAVAIAVANEEYLRRTLFGKAIRATAVDSGATATLGVSVRSVVLASFVVSAVVTAVAGYLVSPILSINPADGLTYTVNGFVAMVIGGLGSSRGAFLGGIIVGVLNSVVVNLINPTIAEMAVVMILALILVIRPTGIFSRPAEQR